MKIETVEQLAAAWELAYTETACPAGVTTQVLGADPRRWAFFMMCSATPNIYFSPIADNPQNKIRWQAGDFSTIPLTMDQRDQPGIVPLAWYLQNTGFGVATIRILSLRWLV